MAYVIAVAGKENDCAGRPTVELPAGSPVREALDQVIRQLEL